ncbi:MAG: hypothetical protein IJP03_03395, partial [Christensenellaceae bacterium]|nr:hypothetical protein [Christensenellaceae bacterium]
MKRKTAWMLTVVFLAALMLSLFGCAPAAALQKKQVWQAYGRVCGLADQIHAGIPMEDGLFSAQSAQQALSEMAEYAKALLAEGVITEYEENDMCLYMKLRGGAGYVYIPPVADVMAGSRGGRVVCMEPFADDANIRLATVLGEAPHEMAERLGKDLPEYTFAAED